MAGSAEEMKQKKDALIARVKARDTKRRVALDIILKSKAGQVLWEWLFELSGYSKPSLVFNRGTGEISDRATVYNDARRALYIMLREKAPVDLLMKAETAAEEEMRSRSTLEQEAAAKAETITEERK